MPTEQPLAEEARTLGALLRIPYEALARENYARLAAEGFADIRPAYSAVFRYLPGHGARVTTLAHHAGMTKQSMAELVEQLRRRGYVDVRPDPADGRARLVCLTSRGEQAIAALIAASNRFEAECERLMGRERWRLLRTLLHDLGPIAATLAAGPAKITGE